MRPVVVRVAFIVFLLTGLGVPRVFSGGTGEEDLGSEERPLVLGFVLPGDQAGLEQEIRRALVPVELSSGYTIKVLRLERYADILDRLAEGTLHLVALPALTCLIALERALIVPGLIALRSPRDDGDMLESVIVGASGIDFTDLSTAAGARYARSDPYDPVGWLEPRIVMAAIGIDATKELRIVDVASEPEMVRAVYDGRADLTMVRYSVLDALSAALPDLAERVQLIAAVETIDGEGIHFRSDLAEPLREAITSALLDMSAGESGLGPLTEAFGWQTFVRAGPSDFEQYRAILSGVGFAVRDLP